MQPLPRDHSTLPRWERTLPSLSDELRARLRRRLPARSADHDDLLNETLTAIAQHIARHTEAVPAAWLVPGPPLEGEDRDALARLAHTILRRRIADLFRARAREWTSPVESVEELQTLVPSREPDVERRTLYARVLQVCVVTMASMTEEDRDLLGGAHEDRALTDRERQRLRRARTRLVEAVRTELGEEAAALLREE